MNHKKRQHALLLPRMEQLVGAQWGEPIAEDLLRLLDMDALDTRPQLTVAELSQELAFFETTSLDFSLGGLQQYPSYAVHDPAPAKKVALFGLQQDMLHSHLSQNYCPDMVTQENSLMFFSQAPSSVSDILSCATGLASTKSKPPLSSPKSISDNRRFENGKLKAKASEKCTAIVKPCIDISNVTITPTLPAPDPLTERKRPASTAALNTDDTVDQNETSLSVEDDKRRRNTAASARFRLRKKQREVTLEKIATDITARCDSLANRVRELEIEVSWLRSLLVDRDQPDKISQSNSSLRSPGLERQQSISNAATNTTTGYTISSIMTTPTVNSNNSSSKEIQKNNLNNPNNSLNTLLLPLPSSNLLSALPSPLEPSLIPYLPLNRPSTFNLDNTTIPNTVATISGQHNGFHSALQSALLSNHTSNTLSHYSQSLPFNSIPTVTTTSSRTFA